MRQGHQAGVDEVRAVEVAGDLLACAHGQLISAVTTRTGLTVQAVLDTGIYQRGIKIPDKEMKAFEARHLDHHQFHGDWNYTIKATSADDATRPNKRK